MTEPSSDFRLQRALALALCCVAYLYVFPYQEKINNPNENVRLYMTAALVEEGRYEIDSLRARWGYVNDAAVRDGHIYSVKAPAASFLAMPAYAGYGALTRALDRPFDRTQALWACRVFASIVPTLVWLWFFYGWLARRTAHPVLRDAVFFSLALGSLLYGYGMLFVSHTQSAATAFVAYMLLFDARARAGPCSYARAFGAGLFAASATLFEYPALPCSVVLTAYAVHVLWRRGGVRALSAYAAGGLIPALAMMHFQWRAFGNPLTPGHLMVENAGFRAAHEQGLYGAVGPSFHALYGLLFDLGAGLFPLTPILCAAPLGFALLLRERKARLDTAYALAVVLLTVLAIGSMNNWRGGWTIGPRYLALVLPFMALPSLRGLEWLCARNEVSTIALCVGATAAGMLASGLPSAYYPHLPPELTRPLPQLFVVLVGHGYAPHNALALLGVYGTASMLPLLAVALSAIALCLRPIEGLRARAPLAGLSLLAALGMCSPLFMRPGREPGVPEAVAFVTRHWSPEGHDAAARLSAKLRQSAIVRDDDLRRLAELYAVEGRGREAQRALRGRP